jgi:quinol monooxygenase YgiN
VTTHTLCGSIRAVEGAGDELARLLLEAADAVAGAPGCLLYLVNRVEDDPDAVWVLEVWSDADAHRASLDLADVRDVIERARPVIAGFGERFELATVGGHGLELPSSG